MARKTPYTASLAIIDVILILLTGGAWLIVMFRSRVIFRPETIIPNFDLSTSADQ